MYGVDTKWETSYLGPLSRFVRDLRHSNPQVVEVYPYWQTGRLRSGPFLRRLLSYRTTDPDRCNQDPGTHPGCLTVVMDVYVQRGSLLDERGSSSGVVRRPEITNEVLLLRLLYNGTLGDTESEVPEECRTSDRVTPILWPSIFRSG